MDKHAIDGFLEFLQNDLIPATEELDKLTDANRVHIQKLVYTNLVDRFDHLIDKLLLSLASHGKIADQLMNDMKEPLTENYLIKFIVNSKGDLKRAAKKRLEEQARQSILRNRHSRKVEKACSVILFDDNLQNPRVNASKGSIMKSCRAHKQIPLSIVGYSDWLYCRRNAIVHGGGNNTILKSDLEHLKQTYKGLKPASTLRLSLSSIRTAECFYRDLANKFKNSPLYAFDEIES